MEIKDFKNGVSFLYKNNPDDDESLIGIGEVVNDTVQNGHEHGVRISWLWSPSSREYTIEDFYSFEQLDYWRRYCEEINDQQKFALYLKHNFG